MIYKVLFKDLVIYHGQDTTFSIQPIELDGWRPDPGALDIEGFIYRPGDSIDTYRREIKISGKTGVIKQDLGLRFDYSYRYNLYVLKDGTRELFQYGNLIFKNEHREPNQPG